MSDPYLYEGTDVLKNKLGLRSNELLSEAEAEAAFTAMRTLPPVEISATGIRDIHRHLFRDVYEWAGDYRTINISKQMEVGRSGRTAFANKDSIPERISTLMEAVRADDGLRGADPAEFARALAPHFHKLNMIHAFREGNGRTQRAFWTGAAEGMGQRLDFKAITGERMIGASIDGARGDMASVEHMLRDASHPISRLQLNALYDGLQRAGYGPDFVNDMNVRTGRVGEDIEGQIAVSSLPFAVVTPDRGHFVLVDSMDLSNPRAGLGDVVTASPSLQGQRNQIASAFPNLSREDQDRLPETRAAAALLDQVRETPGSDASVAVAAVTSALREGQDMGTIDPAHLGRGAEVDVSQAHQRDDARNPKERDHGRDEGMER